MTKAKTLSIYFTYCLLLTGIFASANAKELGATAGFPCDASSSWISNPDAPDEVPKGKNAGFCEFYQFSWQWFLQLVAPSKGDNALRNFQVAANYPILEGKVNNQQQDSCDNKIPPHALFVRTRKSADDSQPFVIPERIGQAGGEDTIYDQQNNVVFYDVRFSKNLCNVGEIQVKKNFPAETTELKTAWRIITNAEKADYFWMEANVDGVPGTELLGMIGFHVAIATDLHPEFIWATFEHRNNDPDCSNAKAAPVSGWSFTSAKCASATASGCTFNKAKPSTSLTGTPTEVCRVFKDATDPSDHKAQENIAIINELNKQLVGDNGFLSKLPDTDPMSVWKNYINVGALWESDIAKPSSDVSNQRGSLRLANTVMETTFQQVDLNAKFVSNCFGCHNYEVGQSNTLSGSLSHIFHEIRDGQCHKPSDVNAGPIWSNVDAQTKCPQTCESKGGWND